jgi:hypothetical protein
VPSAASQLDMMRHAAEQQVRQNFNHNKNLESFCDLFLQRISPPQPEITPHENFVLQQI